MVRWGGGRGVTEPSWASPQMLLLASRYSVRGASLQKAGLLCAELGVCLCCTRKVQAPQPWPMQQYLNPVAHALTSSSGTLSGSNSNRCTGPKRRSW